MAISGYNRALDQIYEVEISEQTIDLSSSNRVFQTSIIIKQDQNKSGILSFLSKQNNEEAEVPQQRGQTFRPSRQGDY